MPFLKILDMDKKIGVHWIQIQIQPHYVHIVPYDNDMNEYCQIL